MSDFIKFVNKFINPLIWFSIILLLIELQTGTANSLEGGYRWFLWVERATATIFIIEYFCRWYLDHTNDEATEEIGHGYYPLSVMGIIDLMAWLPFAAGFFLPVHYLGYIRALRILRLLKLIRYSNSLQLMVHAFMRSWMYVKAMALSLIVTCLLGSVLIHEAEKTGQPEFFGKITNCFWFSAVSATTVGYGDAAPKTDLGKLICVLIFFIPAIFTCAGIIGVVGGTYQSVLDDYHTGKIKIKDNI